MSKAKKTYVVEPLTKIKLPGALWAALLIGATVAIQHFAPGAEWAPFALWAIAALAKWLQIDVDKGVAQIEELASTSGAAEGEPTPAAAPYGAQGYVISRSDVEPADLKTQLATWLVR